MDIQARITARKISLIYIYQRLFVENISIDIQELDSVSKNQDTKDIEFTWDTSVLKQLMNKSDIESDSISSERAIEIVQTLYTNDSLWEDIEYIIDIGFTKSKSKNKIDYGYIKKLLTKFDKYQSIVVEKIDEHTQTFNYEEMDIMDRTVFLLGYIENNEFDTPKNVLINEMIELAKNYWDAGSAKLINGIADNIIS